MQEVEILPRDVFIHYLNVPKGKVILWWFSTKKKNISFGLFQRKDNIVASGNVFIAAPNTPEPYQDGNVTGPISPAKIAISEHKPLVKSLAASLKSRNSLDTYQTDENDDINEDDVNPTLNNQQSSRVRGRKKSVSAQIAKDPSLKEILPVEHYNSATTTIKDIDEDQNEPEISGWLLKKKRKKMQGKIHIVLSTVSSSQSYRSIHLDSGTATYHLKALTNEEFDAWMTVIRKYVNLSNEKQFNDLEYHRASFYQQPGEIERLQSLYFKRQGLLERRQSLNKTIDQQNGLLQNNLDEDLGKIYGVFNNMDNEFKMIKENLDALKSPTTPQPDTIQPPVTTQIPLDQIHDKLSVNVTTLKKDKDQAFNLLRAEIEKWKSVDRAYRKLAAENANLHESHVKNDSFDERLEHESNDIDHADINSMKKTRSMSMSTINTHSELFFDAEDIDLTEDLSATESDLDVSNTNISDEESDSGPTFIQLQPVSAGVYDKPLAENNSSASQPMTIQRRKILPAPICGEDVSLLSILRKNVGKDLSTVAMPISLNEPINILQNMAEALEYSELLDKAASFDNSLERLIYVAAFAVSGYSSTYFRTEACEITFNQSGLWSRSPNSEIVGILFTSNGEKSGKLVGKWNEIIFHEKEGPNHLEVIWKANSPIPDYEQYYGFTQFCIELNELTPDLDGYLPNTDTRLRPDQRLFENGEVEKAEAEKLRLEQKQREYRKLLEERGEQWVPQWFELEGDEWVYKGGYWEARESKSFKTKLHLW
ncbi:2651_t:CDS:2 [Racocetra fulgida]|uniref:2651_t:CDS:1 n=1 Tax=Racocetra fulgida TaxID=60492 RepID=A0A9N9F7A5_9GLOM|nr:2651_t:CDS:2 [Racocetra fulgida]